MKHVVRDPISNAIIATYELKDGSWEVFEAHGPSFLQEGSRSTAPTLIEAILEEHRKKGRVVSEEM